MIVDASALLAILLEEPDGPALAEAIIAAGEPCAMSPVNYVEAAIRIDSAEAPGKSRELDALIEALGVTLATVTPEQARMARAAYASFGKGKHPAKLNLGDCFAYALAKTTNKPLLFKGNDFRMTDVEAAL